MQDLWKINFIKKKVTSVLARWMIKDNIQNKTQISGIKKPHLSG